MRSYRWLLLLMVFVLVFSGWGPSVARAEDETGSAPETSAQANETVSSAPDTTNLLRMAMDDFHNVMAPLWHEAFPKEDFKAIRGKAPLLKEKLMTLLKVKLPSDLEDDQEKLESFFAKRQELAFSVSQLAQAATDTVDSTLALALEQMHWAYEELEKVFAVPIEELDKFHETLYFLWHKALPTKDYDAIRKTAPVLKAEVDSLMKAPLPYGCAKKKDEFEKRKTALKDAVYQLAEVSEKETDGKKIEEALDAMHQKFMELNIFLR
ncbi:MAG: hypothetical protein GTO24_02270 [candidate division Zixibacteria bacterium]|nr:hypothetical protein [candidate division Zixibacteria bacterium]